MTKNTRAGKEQEPRENSFLTERGRCFMREEVYLKRLSERERKAYEECMALIQTMGQHGSLEEACAWLEKYAVDEKNQ